jgi:hypothetical protein
MATLAHFLHACATFVDKMDDHRREVDHRTTP